MKLMNARGTKDLPPNEKIMRNKVVDTLRNVFELYGYSPLQTPLLERFDVLASKYAGGAEILKETFKLSDQGNRELALRYDLTVPFCRFVGMNPHVKKPFKRYQIGRVYRDGPIKLGRMREFLQCDVDVVGAKTGLADAECVLIARRVFKELGMDVVLEVNNRKVLNGIVREVGVSDDKINDIIVTVDKFKKMSVEDINNEFRNKGLTDEQIERLREIFSFDGSNSEKIDFLQKVLTSDEGKEGVTEMSEVLKYCDGENVLLNISLARGLAYYTGTVFEGFMRDGEFKSSLCGGGRYDKMIGDFLGGKQEMPAIGISFGLEPITVMLQKLEKVEDKKTVTELFVVPIGTVPECVELVEKLRDQGVKVEMDISGKGVSKNLDYANALGIPRVLFVGEDELKAGKYKIKNMKTGGEKMLSLAEISQEILK